MTAPTTLSARRMPPALSPTCASVARHDDRVTARDDVRALLLVSELEDYMISFANGVAQHAAVTVAVPHRQYARLAEWFDPAIDLHLMDWPRHRSLSNLKFLLALTSLVRKARPDVIHLLSNNTLWLNLAMPVWRAASPRCPLITTVHDIVVHPGDAETKTLPGWATALAVRQSAHIVVHDEALRHLAIRKFTKSPERVHVLPHPAIPRYVDLARRAGLVRRAGPGVTVLLFGRIFAYKGLDLLVAAEALLTERLPDLRIVIAGRGDDPWSARPAMGDPSRYDMRHRFIEDTEVAQLFLDADIVALPYAEASQSGVLHLAAAFGKPVIATDVGALRPTVAVHGLGLVVPPADPRAFADAIEALTRDPDRRAAFGARARDWANGAGAPGRVGAAAVALYRDVAKV